MTALVLDQIYWFQVKFCVVCVCVCYSVHDVFGVNVFVAEGAKLF